MKLEDIGFYTLSDNRALNVSAWSPMMRCELVLTGRCNFRHPYCRSLRPASCALTTATSSTFGTSSRPRPEKGSRKAGFPAHLGRQRDV
jgi:hypothetical protein